MTCIYCVAIEVVGVVGFLLIFPSNDHPYCYFADWGDCKIVMQFSRILTSTLNNALRRSPVTLLVKLAFSSRWRMILTIFSWNWGTFLRSYCPSELSPATLFSFLLLLFSSVVLCICHMILLSTSVHSNCAYTIVFPRSLVFSYSFVVEAWNQG
jgi:hypothetical protein